MRLSPGPYPIAGTNLPGRGRIGAEVLIVLGLSLGASAAYSVVSIVNRMTRTEALGDQSTSINNPLSPRPTFDLIYQLMGIFFDLVPVALCAFLLWQATRPHLGRLGIDATRPARDALLGFGLALAIGVPGIGVYLGGRALGITVNVVPNALDTYWWTIPVLILSAVRAGVTEEVIMIGYLYARLTDLGWGKWTIIVSSATVRGTYHLYQGFGSFIGNFAMGLLFGWLYTRTGQGVALRDRSRGHRCRDLRGLPVGGRDVPGAVRALTSSPAAARRLRAASRADTLDHRSTRRTPRSADRRTPGCGRRRHCPRGEPAASTWCESASAAGIRPAPGCTRATTHPR